MVYLIHFDKPQKHAQHYIGYADDVEQRFERHQKGQGSKLLQAAHSRGINFQIARTWEGGRQEERQLKRQRNAARYCPICAQKSFQNIDRDKPPPRTRVIGKSTIMLTPNPQFMEKDEGGVYRQRRRVVNLNKLNKSIRKVKKLFS